MTIKEALQKATIQLQRMYLVDGQLSGIPQKERRQYNAHLDAEVLLAHVLSTTREELLIHCDKKIEIKDYKKFQNFVERRLKHEPAAYICGKKEFYGLTFKVKKGVLIPRPETELLVEKALEKAKLLHKKYGSDFVIADIGTGCGNIIIAIAKNLEKYLSPSSHTPQFPKLFAVDVSDEILELARENAKIHQVEKFIEFKKGNLLEPIPIHTDLIVANLPYLPKFDYFNASLDVRLYEPEAALVGGDDGLDYIRQLLEQIARHISQDHRQEPKPWHHTTILLEIDPSQPSLLKNFVDELFPKNRFEIFHDLQDRPRLALIDI